MKKRGNLIILAVKTLKSNKESENIKEIVMNAEVFGTGEEQTDEEKGK